MASVGGFAWGAMVPIPTGEFARCWAHSGAQVSGALVGKLIVYLCLLKTSLNILIPKNPVSAQWNLHRLPLPPGDPHV